MVRVGLGQGRVRVRTSPRPAPRRAAGWLLRSCACRTAVQPLWSNGGPAGSSAHAASVARLSRDPALGSDQCAIAPSSLVLLHAAPMTRPRKRATQANLMFATDRRPGAAQPPPANPTLAFPNPNPSLRRWKLVLVKTDRQSARPRPRRPRTTTPGGAGSSAERVGVDAFLYSRLFIIADEASSPGRYSIPCEGG